MYAEIYIENIKSILDKLETSKIRNAARLIYETYTYRRKIFFVGCCHSGEVATGQIFNENEANKNDLLFIHSTCGCKKEVIDIAYAAVQKNMKIIVLTNLEYSKNTESQHFSKKKLYEFGDVVIDNFGGTSDECIIIEGVKEKFAPSSEAIRTIIMNSIAAEFASLFVKEGKKPPSDLCSKVNTTLFNSSSSSQIYFFS